MEMCIPDSFLSVEDIDPRWNNSPFRNIKIMGAKQKGKRFEQIIRFLMEGQKTISTDNDMQIDNSLFEIKGSTVTKGTDKSFSFLQIRPNQKYDYLLLSAFHYDGTIEIYKIPKQDIYSLIGKVFKKQHEGKSGTSETYCYNGTMEPFSKYKFMERKILNG